MFHKIAVVNNSKLHYNQYMYCLNKYLKYIIIKYDYLERIYFNSMYNL